MDSNETTKQKIIILITVLIDVIGIGIVIPVMPYFVKEIGFGSTVVTTLFAIFALCSFFSAPLLGTLSDKYGRRPILIISLASTAIGWFIFGSAKTVTVLFLGRIVDGIAAGNFPIAQSYIADISKTNKERTQNMGLIGTAFGVGFIIGPAIGAFLSSFSLTLPFYLVGALATINTIGAYFFLPETNIDKQHNKHISVNPFVPIIAALKDKKIRLHYYILFIFALAFATQQSVFALYMDDILVLRYFRQE